MESLMMSGWVADHGGGCNERDHKNGPSHSPWKRETEEMGELEKEKVGGGRARSKNKGRFENDISAKT